MNRAIFWRLALLMWAGNGASNTEVAPMLVVTVENLRSTHGVVIVSLYDSEERFLENAIQKRFAPIEPDKTATVRFESIQQGSYAFTVIHDENNNGTIDRNFLGIPREAYAFSNNAKARFAPPSFDEAQFLIVDGTNEHRVHLQ